MINILTLCSDGSEVGAVSCDNHYVYRFGFPPTEETADYQSLNDQERLNEIGDRIRHDYAEWVHSHRVEFSRAGLKDGDFSYFSFSDFSTKRGEVFDTFDKLCGLLLLKEVLSKTDIQEVRVVDLGTDFKRAAQTVFPDSKIHLIGDTKRPFVLVKRMLSDGWFLIKYFLIALFFGLLRAKNQQSASLNGATVFHTFFPSMVKSTGLEEKYGSFAESGVKVGSIIADGMHQHVPITEFRSHYLKARSLGVELVDREMRPWDIFFCMRVALNGYSFFARRRYWVKPFMGLDISGLARDELAQSVSRMMRLATVRRPYRRFLEKNKLIKKIFVYPIEYPYGRMICHEARRVSPKILMTGYQMGPVSLRRLEQVRSKCERRDALVRTTDMVMPDEMYVEDEFSRKVYEANGYQNVVLMDRVFRCEYLRLLAPNEGRDLILLATGLHDLPSLINAPQLLKLGNDPGTFAVKLHPRSGHYAEFVEKCMERGLKVVEETIGQLLPRTKKIFATYSSVALEARALGIEVEIIDIPGRINTLSLADR